MNVQRVLRLLGCVLFVLTGITGLVLPSGMVPMMVNVGLAAATGVVFLLAMAHTLFKNRNVRGLIQALMIGALVVSLVGAVGSHLGANALLVELPLHKEIVLEGRGLDGYSMSFDSLKGDTLEDSRFEVGLTDPEHITYHETITMGEPLKMGGIEIHPMEVYAGSGVFLIEYDYFHYVTLVGGILFLIGLGLSTLPPARKRGED